MAKTWHKVMGKNGFAIYRASASKTYVSYNPENGSFSSKMLLGNVPVEVLAKAPKTIKVKGKAWGVEVVRSYLEGEKPVTHTIAYKGEVATTKWDWELKKDIAVEAKPDVVSFHHSSYTDGCRQQIEENVAYIRDNMAQRDAGKLDKYSSRYSCMDVVIVELR